MTRDYLIQVFLRSAEAIRSERGDAMQPVPQVLPIPERTLARSTTITTTLYELIEAISEEVQLGEDWLVNEVVLDLLDTSHTRFSRDLRGFKTDAI